MFVLPDMKTMKTRRLNSAAAAEVERRLDAMAATASRR